jgi:magnesium-transporting ATPase (P-type)
MITGSILSSRSNVSGRPIDEDTRVNVLLAEYQLAQMNRDHYESGRWNMGTIFIAASLTLFGISFLRDVNDNPPAPLLIAVFSILLMVIWGAYNVHVQPYVELSFSRLHEIERTLRELGYLDIPRLHATIRAETIRQRRGIWITIALFVVILLAWAVRILLPCSVVAFPYCILVWPLVTLVVLTILTLLPVFLLLSFVRRQVT